jgi:hypothetical protein
MDLKHIAFVTLIAILFVDRYFIKRVSVRLLGIGAAVVKGNALAFPMKIFTQRRGIGDARVDYIFRDLRNPSVVITGKSRPIECGTRGTREEYLLIDTRYLEPAEWELVVRVTNSNCRMNPLYRIFPLIASQTRRYSLTKTSEGNLHVKP